jgi:hypothetical protein
MQGRRQVVRAGPLEFLLPDGGSDGLASQAQQGLLVFER